MSNNNERDVARGIAREKARESLSVIMVIGAVIAAYAIGNATEAWVGLIVLLVSFWRIWKFYIR